MVRVARETQHEFAAKLHENRASNVAATISNCFPWQTKLATLELLSLAADRKHCVRILSGTATEQFYGDAVFEAIRQCAIAGCEIRVLIWNDNSHVSAQNSILEKLLSLSGLIKIALSGTREHGEKLAHLLLVGTVAYRLEAPHKYMDDAILDDVSPETRAKICFNDPSGGKELEEFFDTLWDVSEVIPAQDVSINTTE